MMSSMPMSVTVNTTFSRCAPISSSKMATSVIVSSRFRVPSMLYSGIGVANFRVTTRFSLTNRLLRKIVVAPLSTMATTSFRCCLPISCTGT